MPTEEIDLEEQVTEGAALVNSGLTHLRTVLEGRPVEFYTLFAWLRGASMWIRETDKEQDVPIVKELTDNLIWLNLRLTPQTPAGPADFVVKID